MRTPWQCLLVMVYLLAVDIAVGQPKDVIEVDCDCSSQVWDLLFSNCKGEDLKVKFDSAKVSMNSTNIKTMDVVFHAKRSTSEAITYAQACWIAAAFAAILIVAIHMGIDTKIRNGGQGTSTHTLVLAASTVGLLVLCGIVGLATKLPQLPSVLNLVDGPIVLGVNTACLCGAIALAKQYGLASEVKTLVKQLRPW